MADSVYRVTEVIGVSGESWEAAARTPWRPRRRAFATYVLPRSSVRT